MLQISLLIINRLNKTEYSIFIFFFVVDVVLASEGSKTQNLFIFTAAGVMPFDGSKTSPRKSS